MFTVVVSQPAAISLLTAMAIGETLVLTLFASLWSLPMISQVGVEDVTAVLSALLEAPVLPAGGAVLDVAGTGVDAGTVQGQLASALAAIGEKNAEKNAAREAEQRETPTPRPAAPKSPLPFGFGAKVG